MDDLESRLDDQLSRLGRVPLAEPVPVDDLRRRARHVRAGRALTGVVATATAIVLIAGVVIVTRKDPGPRTVQVAAPDFVLGDIDAVVLSSSLDADGARNPLPASLAAKVAAVPGVQAVSGVVDTFAPKVDDGSQDAGPALAGTPPRTPILFTYHEGEDVQVVSGRAPEATDEIIVDAEALSRYGAAIGDKVTLDIRGARAAFEIVGTFELPDIDLASVPLAALSAAYQPHDLPVDRLDVKFTPAANLAKVRDAITRAVGDYTVVAPSVISFPEQRLAQLEIQRAYWGLLSPDQKQRTGAGAADAKSAENYARYADLAKSVELRVENVAFLSPDDASLTYRIYYGGSPSPIVDEPQRGSATRVDGHWQLGTSTLCSLAALVGIKCEGDAANVKVDPPTGYQPVNTLDPEIARAFSTLADPHTSVEQRAAVVAGGNTAAIHPVVVQGATDDQSITKSTLAIAGWKQTAPTRIEVLYSLQTEGGPSTPWPMRGAAEKTDDGHWYAAPEFACGIVGLTSGGCSPLQPEGVTRGTAPRAPLASIAG